MPDCIVCGASEEKCVQCSNYSCKNCRPHRCRRRPRGDDAKIDVQHIKFKKRKQGIDYLSNQSSDIIALIETYLQPEEKTAMRQVNKAFRGTVTAEERFWTDPELVEKMYSDNFEEFYYEEVDQLDPEEEGADDFQIAYDEQSEASAKSDLRNILTVARSWAAKNPEVEVVLAYTDKKGAGQCYICDVGGTLAGIVMGFLYNDELRLDRGIAEIVILRTLHSFLRRPCPLRVRRLDVITHRTQLCIIPRWWDPEGTHTVRDVLGNNLSGTRHSTKILPLDGNASFSGDSEDSDDAEEE